MKNLLFLVVALFMGLYSLSAQEAEISGKVTAGDDGSPLIGVAVVVKGTTQGTITDVNGEYRLPLPADAQILVFSYVGMKTLEVPISGRSIVDVVLQPDLLGLEEVVVTALGIRREKKALAYSSQSVDNELITTASQANLTNALQGKVAGVSVQQSSGMPGSSSLIMIRGGRFLSDNNEPLFVVDGMPIESKAIFTEPLAVNRVSNSDASSRALDINPEDIESIEILKGPVASALYGLRASNGVVLITTKSGKGLKAGEGKITFTTAYTADIATRFPELQSTYAQGNNGILQQGTSMSWGPKIEDLGEYVNIVGETVTGKLYDNVNPFFQNGGTYSANLGFSRAVEKGNYDISVGYTDQQGVIPGTEMARYTGKYNGEFDLTDKLSVGGSAMYTFLNVDKIPNGSNLSNPLFTVYYAPRSFDLWGIPYAREDDPFRQIHYRSTMDNPRWSLDHNAFNEQNDRFIGNAHAAYKPWDWITFSYQVGIDNISNQQKEVYDLGSGETGGRTNPPSGGRVTDFSYTQRELNSNFSLALSKKLGSFQVDVTLGSEFYDKYSRDMKNIGSGFDIGGYHNIANTASQVVQENINRYRVFGMYNSTTVAYKSMFYLTGTLRNDKVSNLVRGNRSFLYPSIGGSFVFTELIPINENILTFGKLRASYASVGQAYTADPYPTQNIFLSGGTVVGGFLNDGIQFPFAGSNAFTHDFVLNSPDLTPQNTITYELGIDLRFMNGRVNVDYTYFDSKVVDQIFQVPIAPSSGYLFELRNAGELKSQGHEVMLGLMPVKTSDFNWNINVNFTRYRNEVVQLAPGVTDIYLGGFTTPSIRALAGETFPSIYGVGYLRDDEGSIVMLDDPGNPYHGIPLFDPDAKKIGDVQPDFLVGFTNTFSYKGVTLTAIFDWKQGGEMYSGNNRLGRLYGAMKITEDRETPVVLKGSKGYIDDNGDLVITGKNDIAILRNSRYWNDVIGNIDEPHVHETSYVRFRELSVGFQVPRKWLDNFFASSASVSFVGRNLALWSTYPNFDPETSTTGATNGQGLEYVALPQVMSFGGKVSVTF